MPTVAIDGTSIFHERSGRRPGPAIVLSSSLGTTLDMWSPQLPALESGFDVVRYDMRGHGRSAIPPGPYSIADLGRDVLALVEALALDQVVFCGISLGGLIGQWLAIHAPERFRAFVLANTAAKIGTERTWNQRIATVQAEGMATIADGTMQRWFTHSFRQTHPDTTARMKNMLLACDPAGYTSACAAVRDADFRDTVAAIRAPTLIVAGAADEVTTPADARFLHRRIAGSTLVTLAAAHISNVEDAPGFNAALLSFLS